MQVILEINSQNRKCKILIKSVMDNAEKEGIRINCYISDLASEYTVARRQLRIEYSNKVFIPCMAHQMNLVVGNIFKESDAYKKTLKNAIRIVSYFHSTPYFTELLQDEQRSCYGQTVSLLFPAETR